MTGNAAITVYENVPFAFATSDFPYSDSNNSPPTALKAVIVVAPPTTGALTDDGVAVTAGQAISAADIASGDLVYTPAANAVGTAVASFTFEVENSGGTTGGGVDTSTSATLTVNVQQKQPIAGGGFTITDVVAPGAFYSYYTVTYSAKGQALSIAYSDGMSAAYEYNANGSLSEIEYTDVVGQLYTSYNVIYNAKRQVATIDYSDGMTAAYTYNSNGTLHDIDYANVVGRDYASYDLVYGSNGQPASAIYSSGMTATYNYNTDGTIHDVDYDDVIGAPYTSYDIAYSLAVGLPP